MNEKILMKAKEELSKLNDTPQGEHIKTGDIRSLSSRLFRSLEDKSIDAVFSICADLLEERNWPMGVIAFDFAYRMKDQYNDDTFAVFENWLEKYVRGWGDCDDFCTHAFGELICQNTALVDRVFDWTKREEFWMRRASAVVLIPSIWRGLYNETDPLRVSDALMQDEHDLVRKGYGWMLKILSVKESDMVYGYLEKNKEIMPRVSFRYALEKFDAEKRRALMR